MSFSYRSLLRPTDTFGCSGCCSEGHRASATPGSKGGGGNYGATRGSASYLCMSEVTHIKLKKKKVKKKGAYRITVLTLEY